MASLHPPDNTLWRRQLSTSGYARCTNPSCRLCFLSLAGVVEHHKSCPGWIREGDFLACIHCGERFKQFRSVQTHVEKAHREHDSDAELEAEEQRRAAPPAPSPRLPQLPPDVVPRQYGAAATSTPRRSLPPPPAASPSPQMFRTAEGKMLFLTPTPSPLRPRLQPTAQVPNISFWSRAAPGRPVVFANPSPRPSPSPSLSGLDQELEAGRREVAELEARAREVEEQARRRKEQQLAQLEERKEEARRRLASAQRELEEGGQGGGALFAEGVFQDSRPPLHQGAQQLQNRELTSPTGCIPRPSLPHRPIVVPSRFRLPDSARPIRLSLSQARDSAPPQPSEEAPLDLSATKREPSPAPSTGSTVQDPASPSRRQGSQSPILERVLASPEVPSHTTSPLVSPKSSPSPLACSSPPRTVERSFPSPAASSSPPLVEISCSNLTEMLGVSPLVRSSPPGLVMVGGGATTGEERAILEATLKLEDEIEGIKPLESGSLGEAWPTQSSNKKQEKDPQNSGEQPESGPANIAIPYEECQQLPSITEGGSLDLEQLLARSGGGVLTLMATEGPDGNLTLTSPPLGKQAEDVTGAVAVQDLEAEFGLLRSQVRDIIEEEGEEEVAKGAALKVARTRTTSTVMAEICQESSLDTLEKQIESPVAGGDLVEDFEKRLEEMERTQGELLDSSVGMEESDADGVGVEEEEEKEMEEEMEKAKPDLQESSVDALDEKLETILVKSPLHGWNNFSGEENICDAEQNEKSEDAASVISPEKSVLKKSIYTKEKQSPEVKKSSLRPRIKLTKRMPEVKSSKRKIDDTDDDLEPSIESKRRRKTNAVKAVDRPTVAILPERRSSRLQSRDTEDACVLKRHAKSPKGRLVEQEEPAVPSLALQLSNKPEESLKLSKVPMVDVVHVRTPEKVPLLPETSLEKSPKSKFPPIFSASKSSRKSPVREGPTSTCKPKNDVGTTLKKGKSKKEVTEHLRRCGQEGSQEVEVQERAQVVSDVTPSGRSRRAAATKAKGRVAEFVKQITKKYDGDSSEAEVASDVDISGDSDSDDNFDIKKEIGAPTLYTQILDGKGKRLWNCTVCNKEFPNQETVEGHIFIQHQQEVEVNQETESEPEGESEVESEDFENEDSDDSYDIGRPKSRQSRKRKRSGENTSSSSLRRLLLEPCPEVVAREAAFRDKAYSKATVFPELQFKLSTWTLEEKESVFLPQETVSPKFTISQSNAKPEEGTRVLERFQGAASPQSRLLYCGGPVWGLAWCPLPRGQPQVVAVAGGLEHGTTTLGKAGGGPGLLQFWQCGLEEAPVFQFGLGHRYGRVGEVTWCPSGGWDSHRLGLLAAACADGTVRVWAVPRPEHVVKEAVYSGEATLSLHSGGEEVGQCSGLSWHRGPGHRHLAACFSSGMVCVWDLASESSLLRTSPSSLLPHHSWLAHAGSVTGVSLCPDTSVLARHLVTGGTDRCYRFWDLRDTSAPLQEIKRGLVTGVSWLPGWAAASVCYDDVFLQAHTQTLIAESGFQTTRSQPVIAQNSGVWGLHTSPWLGAVAVGTAAGEVIVFVVPPSDRSMEHDKNVCQRRCYVYRTELEVEAKGEEDRREYGAMREATLGFRDLASGRPGGGDCPLEETRRVRCAERMDQEDLACYPLAMVTRVAWSPNLESHLELASGGQAGLVRLHRLRVLETAAVRQAVREVEGR